MDESQFCGNVAHVDGCPGIAGGEHEPRRVRVSNSDSVFDGRRGTCESVTSGDWGTTIMVRLDGHDAALPFGGREIELR